MTDTVTDAQKAILRTNGQFSILKLGIVVPDVMMVCQVNGTPASNDEVRVVPFRNMTYGGGSTVMNGMTCYIGSASGDYSSGMVRVLSASVSGSSVSGSLVIGRTSEITWTDGLYLTVVNDFGLWPKQAKFNGGVFYCDDVTKYTNQHRPEYERPVPVLGPDAVLELSGSSVSLPRDASNSWAPSDLIGDYLWWATGGGAAVTWDDPTAPDATPTFTAPGNYVLHCTISTVLHGIQATGHRVVYVWSPSSPPITQFDLPGAIQGNWQEGGWNFDVTMYAQASGSAVHDRAKVFLFTQDYYGGSSLNLGPLAGWENVIASGWIAGESIEWNAELSTVKFSVKGPHWWLDHIASWPAGIVDVQSGIPTNWNEMFQFGYDKYAWHVLTWRCTALEVLDWYPSGDLRETVGATAPWGTVWGQITTVGENNFLIHPCCNRYGQLYTQKDSNYQYAADRTGIPVIMEVTKTDWRDSIDIERRTVQEVAFEDCAAMAWPGPGWNPLPYRSGSWGTSVGGRQRGEQRAGRRAGRLRQ